MFMKTWKKFVSASVSMPLSAVSKVGFGLLLLCLATSSAFAQQRVDAYTVQTNFSGAGEWNDLSQTGNASYLANEIHGWSQYDENYNPVNTTIPFDFKYDNATISSGSNIYVGSNSISFEATPPTYQTNGGLGSNSFPGNIIFWGADAVNAGTGYSNYAGYDATGLYGVYAETDGSYPNRVFTIQWTCVHTSYSSGYAQEGGDPTTQYLCSMQVKLFEGSGKIQFLYQNHDQYLGGYYSAGIGLNGFTSPSFSSLTYESGVTSTPSSDLQFSPPAPPQELSLEPHFLSFGTTTPQAPITMCVTASSAGGEATTLHIQNIALTGSTAFTIVSGPPIGTAIPVGSSVNYCIQFLPLSPGIQNGVFTLTTDGVDSGRQTVSLNGIGAVPLVSYSANSMFRGVNTELTDTSGVQYLYVNSIGGQPLVVNSVHFIGFDARAYIVTHLPAGPIAGGGVDSIGVRFLPDLEGLPDAHMVINTTAANIPWDTVAMYGVGILPHLSIDSGKSYPLPVTLNFDSVNLGAESCLQVLLTNPGSDTLAIVQNYFESADFDFSLTPLTGRDTLIAPGGSKSIKVCFTPLQQGTRVATIRIRTNIPHTITTPPQDTSSFIVNIVGRGVPTGKLSITGPSTNGSSPVGTSACAVDTFWNTGAVDLTVNAVNIAGTHAPDFTATYPALPFVLPANSYKTFTVCAAPSDSGQEMVLLTATATSNETEKDTALFGLAVYGDLTSNTDVISRPYAPLSCTSDTAVITVTNTGNVSQAYSAAIGIGGSNPADFTVLAPTTSSLESNGGQVQFEVVFTPSTNGTETANLSITGGAPQTIPLSAIGGAATIAGQGTAETTPVGSTSPSFAAIVNNTGTCSWTPGVPNVSAPFAYLSGGLTPIPAGGSDTMTFTFSPTLAGTFMETLIFPNQVGTLTSVANVIITGSTSSEDVAASSSKGYSLEQNYPNPFSASSQLEMTLPVASLVHLSIIDVQGKTVETVLNQHFDAGTFGVTMNADGLSSGTYYYQMTAGDVTLTRQMVILK